MTAVFVPAMPLRDVLAAAAGYDAGEVASERSSAMVLFEWVILLLTAAVVLSAVAGRLGVPYPTMLAVGGAALAFVPHAPRFELEPGLVLALFVAPVLLDAAFDTSLRDLKDNWLPVGCLVLVAVGVTTLAVAVVAHFAAGVPWAAAVTLGAIVAPPDAAAVTAVLRGLRLPHRLSVVLEGESLLNDASALLIYKIAVAAAMSGQFSAAGVLPTAVVVVLASVAAGVAAGWVWMALVRRVTDVPAHIVLQFVGTFVVWIGAEKIGLSGILTMVAFGITLARLIPPHMPAKLRVPSFAVWETATFVANVLAFLLIGLQLRPIFEPLDASTRQRYLLIAAAVLATVIVARVAWCMTYNTVARWVIRRFGEPRGRPMQRPTVKSGIFVAWCGCRGIVTLAAALALSTAFPHRDLIVLCAFGVVLGTLVLQGLTLKPLLARLNLSDDGPIDREVNLARCHVFSAALKSLDGDESPTALGLRAEFSEALQQARDSADGNVPEHLARDVLLRRTIAAARETIHGLRSSGRIGDAAFHRLEEDVDRMELNVGEA